jgi:hypothetical protein
MQLFRRDSLVEPNLTTLPLPKPGRKLSQQIRHFIRPSGFFSRSHQYNSVLSWLNHGKNNDHKESF